MSARTILEQLFQEFHGNPGVKSHNIDGFTAGFIEALLTTTTDDDGRHLDKNALGKNYTRKDFAPEALQKIVADCQKFQQENTDDLMHRSAQSGGIDFFLTREGHGAGFWDGGWPEDAGKRLTRAAKAYGEISPYIGDDQKIHVMGEPVSPLTHPFSPKHRALFHDVSVKSDSSGSPTDDEVWRDRADADEDDGKI